MRRNPVTIVSVVVGLCMLVVGAWAATTVGSLEPTTGTWRAYRGTGFTTLVCSNSSEAAMLACVAADAERRRASTRYQLRYPNRYVSVTYSASPPPPPTSQWTLCANEYETCSFSGTRRVRFGLNSSWVERDLTAANGGAPCRIATFGSDPVVGVTKRCELRNVASEPATGTASLSWTPPTQYTNGDQFTDLRNYRIVYSQSSGALSDCTASISCRTAETQAGSPPTFTVTGLATGTWYFAVKAVAASGTESSNSNVVTKAVQ